jgi:hypothetical protein
VVVIEDPRAGGDMSVWPFTILVSCALRGRIGDILAMSDRDMVSQQSQRIRNDMPVPARIHWGTVEVGWIKNNPDPIRPKFPDQTHTVVSVDYKSVGLSSSNQSLVIRPEFCISNGKRFGCVTWWRKVES